jgi:virginiamycin B lyase
MTRVPTGLPAFITRGPDNNLWFTESKLGSDQIGRLTSAGVFTEFAVPTDASEPSGITTGPDGNLWFTEGNDSNLGRITESGVITEFPVPEPDGLGITLGPDGALWFVAGNKVLRFAPP